MRKHERPYGIFYDHKSAYSKSDYRSRNYHGNWTFAWIKACYEQAYSSGRNVYDIMWEKGNKKIEHLPDKLYKFFPFNTNSLKCIESDKVYLNEPSRFNDPFDCQVNTDETEFVKKYLIEYIKKSDAIKRGVLSQEEFFAIQNSICFEPQHWMDTRKSFEKVLFEISFVARENLSRINELLLICSEARKIYTNVITNLREQSIRVCCFSNMDREYLNIALEMWGHYAQSHSGFCVEYDLKKFVHLNQYKIPLGLLFPCTYQSKGMRIPKEYFYKVAMNKKLTPFQQREFDNGIMKTFLIKSSSWSYENEWRIIASDDICAYYDYMMPFFPASKIYLGCNMKLDNKEYMYSLAKRKGIDICDMQVLDTKFSLTSVDVNVDMYFAKKDFKKQKNMNELDYDMLKKIWLNLIIYQEIFSSEDNIIEKD